MSDTGSESAAAIARRLRETGSVQVLLEQFGEIQEGTPEWDNLDLLLEIARAHSLAGNEKAVERFFGRCVELHPRRAALYHCQVGWFYQRRKRWARAIDWYDSALKTFPNYHLCLFRRGYCLERLHRPAEAMEALHLAGEIFAASPPDQQARSRGIQIQAYFHLSRNYRETGALGAAREALKACGDLDQGADQIIRTEHRLASRAEISLQEGHLEEARDDLLQARVLDPTSPVIWERLGRAYAALGQKQEAETALLRASELPRGAVALLSLARFYRNEHRFLESAQTLAVALREHPRGELQIRLEMARLHLDLARPQAALEILQKLANGRVPPLSTINTTVRTAIADIHAAAGRRAAAIDELKDVVANNITNQPLQRRFADLLELQQNRGDEPTPTEDQPLPADLAEVLIENTPREDGEILSYFPDRGFGFIAYGAQGDTIFFHISQCPHLTDVQPTPGVPVTFILGSNHRTGKAQALEVTVVEAPALQAAAATAGEV